MKGETEVRKRRNTRRTEGEAEDLQYSFHFLTFLLHIWRPHCLILEHFASHKNSVPQVISLLFLLHRQLLVILWIHWMSEWMNEQTNEQTNESVNEWISNINSPAHSPHSDKYAYTYAHRRTITTGLKRSHDYHTKVTWRRTFPHVSPQVGTSAVQERVCVVLVQGQVLGPPLGQSPQSPLWQTLRQVWWPHDNFLPQTYIKRMNRQ